MKKIFLAFGILCSIPAFAQQAQPYQVAPQGASGFQSQGERHHNFDNMPPEVKAALEACRASAPRGADGRPVKGSIRQCMESKGFHGHHEHQNNQ